MLVYEAYISGSTTLDSKIAYSTNRRRIGQSTVYMLRYKDKLGTPRFTHIRVSTEIDLFKLLNN